MTDARQEEPPHWSELAGEDRALAHRARTYLDQLGSVRAQAELERRFPVEIIPDLLDLGYVRGAVSRAAGGLGFSYMQQAALMEEAGRCWGSLRTTTNILTLVAETLSHGGTEEQKQRFLMPLLAGTRLGFFAISEPEAGSDAAGLRTIAKRVPGGGYRLTGRKTWITNASLSDFGIVLAKTDDTQGSAVTAFLVEAGPQSFAVVEHPHLPVRAVSLCDVDLDGVHVPDSNVLGELGRGLSLGMRAVNTGRLNVSAGCVGLAQAALEIAIGHSRTREQFGRAIASFQLVQQLVVDMAVQTSAGRELYRRAARLLDADRDARVDCAIAKYFCAETVARIASNGVQVLGAAGLIEGHPIERIFRDAREATIPEGTSQMQILSIGRALLGVSALR